MFKYCEDKLFFSVICVEKKNYVKKQQRKRFLNHHLEILNHKL